MSAVRALAAGAAAGAAGTTALHAITYLDMVWRARAASSTPEATVKKLASAAGVTIPGSEEERSNRIAGLGPLTGIIVGIGTGAALGLARAAGFRPGMVVTSMVAAAATLTGSNGPMAALGVTDPHRWSAADWLSDIVPHLVYGAVTGGTLQALDPDSRRR